jgi:type IV secretion system protein VirB4
VLGDQHIPYMRHEDEQTVVLKSGEVMSILEIEGLPFETADMDDINAHDRSLNALLLNVADENVMLWSLTIRRRVSEYPEGQFGSTFAQALDDRYRERLNKTDLFRNRMFLAILRAPFSGAGGKLGKKLKSKVATASVDVDFLAKHKDKVLAIKSGLQSVGARELGLYEHNGVWWSEIATVLHWMLGGRMPAVPLTTGPVWSAIYQDRVLFGGDTFEVRYPHETRYGAIFGLKDYPSTCRPTMMDELLTVPCEVTSVQSWQFVGKATAREILTKRSRQILSTQDGARKQIPLLEHALDELQDNKFTFGEHQSSVTVWGETVAQLNDHVANVRTCLMKGGAIVAREDMGLEGAFWAQMPGNAAYRARSGYITTRNLACLSPLHGFDANERGCAVLLQLACARLGEHLHLRAVWWRQDRFDELSVGAEPEVQSPHCCDGQGSWV